MKEVRKQSDRGGMGDQDSLKKSEWKRKQKPTQVFERLRQMKLREVVENFSTKWCLNIFMFQGEEPPGDRLEMLKLKGGLAWSQRKLT